MNADAQHIAACVDANLMVVDLIDQLERLSTSTLWWHGSTLEASESLDWAGVLLGRVGLNAGIEDAGAVVFPRSPLWWSTKDRAALRACIDALREARDMLEVKVATDPEQGIRPMAEGKATGGLGRNNARLATSKRVQGA